MKTAVVVENSGHCIYFIGLIVLLKLSFAVSFSVLYMYIYNINNGLIIYIYVCVHVMYNCDIKHEVLLVGHELEITTLYMNNFNDGYISVCFGSSYSTILRHVTK